MNVISLINDRKHDLTAIRGFLIHCAGELRRQQLALKGEPVPAKLEEGVRQYREKYGMGLLPDATSSPTADGGIQGRDAARQALIVRRGEQIKSVMGVFNLLGDLMPVDEGQPLVG